jgi:hypothetical protein
VNRVILLAAIGCYQPHPEAGSMCAGSACPSGLVCSPATDTCELTAVPAIDASLGGPSVDAPAAPLNDKPDQAIDVTAGGMFTDDLRGAADDAPETDCGGDGGRDVFYEVTLTAPQVYYVDTFDSDFATVVRVIPGADCVTAVAAAMTSTCSHDECGGVQSQLALSLPTGTSCIIVDQHAGDPNGMLMMNVMLGGRDGSALATGMMTYDGTSCSGVNASKPSCTTGDSETSQDVAYFFTACPGVTRMLDASTCAPASATHYDTVMYLRPIGSTTTTIACNDDSNTCAARTERPGKPDGSVLTNAAANGALMYWLTVDGYGGACGDYQLVTTLQ